MNTTITIAAIAGFALGLNVMFLIVDFWLLKPMHKGMRDALDGWKDSLELLEATAKQLEEIEAVKNINPLN